MRIKNKVQRLPVYFGLLTFLLSACDYPDLTTPKPNENVRNAADFIKNNYDFSLFYAALEYTGLLEELKTDGPFTVLVPGDAAFNELGIYLPSDIQKLDRDSLRRVIGYHILPGRRLLAADIPTNGIDIRYETMSGDKLFLSAATISPLGNTYDRFFVDGAEAVRKDVILANGVLHVLNKVMKYQKGETVQDFLQKTPEYSVYVAGLKKFGLWDELAQPGPFTIFAPNNQAFEDNGVTLESVNALDPEVYDGNRLFGSYIMYGKHYFVSDRTVYYNINNESNFQLNLRNDDWYVMFNDGPTLELYGIDPRGFDTYIGFASGEETPWKSDNLCENGLVHNVDIPMVLPEQVMNEAQ